MNITNLIRNAGSDKPDVAKKAKANPIYIEHMNRLNAYEQQLEDINQAEENYLSKQTGGSGTSGFTLRNVRPGQK